MCRLRILWRRFLGLFQKGQLDAALNEEVRFHLEMETERHIRNGLNPEGARLAALRSFGGVETVKESYRDQGGLPGLECLGHDFTHALRTLRRRPGYTAVAVLSLALGIGANTAVFSLLEAFVLRPLPYPEPDRLVAIHAGGRLGGRFRAGAVSAPLLRDWRERSRAFTAMGGFMTGSVNLTGPDGAMRVPATVLEPGVFQALEVGPLAGRVLLPENTNPGSDRVVVLSHQLWQDRYGGDQSVVGRTLRVDAADHVIVGVMPPGFEFPPRTSVALWVPMPLSVSQHPDRGLNRLSVVARIKAGVSFGAARRDMANASRQIEAIYPDSRTPVLRPLHGDTLGRTALVLVVLAGAVALVLLLACTNVAHMVLARANTRRQEFAVRLALGAGRLRIMRLLLAEGFILAAAGGLIGLAACRWLLDALLSLPDNPLASSDVAVSVSWSVMGYCALVSLLTALGVSLIPALRLSRQRLQADLSETVPSARRRARHGNFLIPVEVGLSIVLVIGAGMLVRSLRALTDLDLGFRPENILTMRLSVPPDEYPDVPRLHSLYDRLLERLSAVPGVEAVGLNNVLPIQMAYTNMDFTVEGLPSDRPGYEPFAEHRTVSHDFFRAMGIPVLAGRAFTQEENRRGSGVILVSKRAADLYWPGQDPVGKRLAYGTKPKPDRWLTIIGVVGDIKSAGLGQPPQAILYAPYRDFDFPVQVSLVVRPAGPPASMAKAIRRGVTEMDPDLALYWVSTMEEVIYRSTTGTRFLAVLLSMFSVLAVLLGIIGVYGVMSYSVTQRYHEIGVRMAMGASRGAILRTILGHGTRRALIGIGLGAVWAVSLSLAIRPFLIGTGPVDPVSHLSAAIAVFLVALAASVIPAYRASRIDPVQALRHE